MAPAARRTRRRLCSTSSTARPRAESRSRISVRRPRSAVAMPAAGSSSSRTRGSDASAAATISSRCSVAVRRSAGSAALPARPTSARARAARPRAAAASARERGVARIVRTAPASRRRTSVPAIACSRAVRPGNTDVAWRVRTTPVATRSLVGRSVTSRPSAITEPSSAASSPASRRRSVVLPEPLGPIRARTSPGTSARSTPPTATTPPNRRTSPRASSTGPAVVPGGVGSESTAASRAFGSAVAGRAPRWGRSAAFSRARA